MNCTVALTPNAKKQLNTLPKAEMVRISENISLLEANPWSRGSRKLEGANGLYRVRCGNYRVVYSVDQEAKLVTVTAIGHRSDVYRRR